MWLKDGDCDGRFMCERSETLKGPCHLMDTVDGAMGGGGAEGWEGEFTGILRRRRVASGS